MPAMRLPALAIAGYAVLLGSLATPLYEPLASGDDLSSLVLLMAGCVSVALGVAVPRLWCLAGPFAVTGVVIAADREGTTWIYFVMLGLPVLVCLTLFGWIIRSGMGRRAGAFVVVLLALACLAPIVAAIETARRGPPLPPAVQRQLPLAEGELHLLCDTSRPTAAERRRTRRRAEVLVRELERRPQHLAAYGYVVYDTVEPELITIREVAQEQLPAIEINPSCAPDLQRRLRAAL
jgi:hypothetical protein